MCRLLTVFTCYLLCSSTLLADPIEWKIEDGGNGHFYELISRPSGYTWTEAHEDAQARTFEGFTGHLVTVTSIEEHNFLEEHYFLWAIWIGLTDRDVEGRFEWVTGEPFDFDRWGNNEPNNAGNEDYASYTSSPGFWNDYRDERSVNGDPFSYIVEYDLQGEKPKDCDENGIPDFIEISSKAQGDCNKNGIPDNCDLTSGLLVDENQDGIPDGCEGECSDGSFLSSLEMDFEGPHLKSVFSMAGYAEEEDGSRADVVDLNIEHSQNEVRIFGRGNVDTKRLDNRNSGWFGRSLFIEGEFPIVDVFTVTTEVAIQSQTFSRNAGSGYQATIYMEFNKDNRIYLSLHEERSGGRIVTLGFDEQNDHRHDRQSFNFELENTYTIGLKFNPENKRVAVLIDGSTFMSGSYSGLVSDVRVGVSAAVRTIDDRLDARFKNISVEGACLENLVHFDDCNLNLFDDAEEIERGDSEDLNQDGVPDECQRPSYRRGDSNVDGVMDIADPIYTMRAIFLDKAKLSCEAAADVNDDGVLDTSDILYSIGYLFLGTEIILPPGPHTCGELSADAELSCEEYDRCD